MDWILSAIDGIRLCRAVRQGSGVPIIMRTSNQDGRSEALAAGANEHVRKPFVRRTSLAYPFGVAAPTTLYRSSLLRNQ